MKENKEQKKKEDNIIYENCKKRLEKAVIQLLYSFHIGSKNKKPDIDIIAKSLFVLEFVISDKYTETAAIDIKNKRIFLNQNFVNKINDDELIGLILHEMMHMILLSDIRFDMLEYKDHETWNMAQDLWINDFLKNFNDISLPDCGLTPDVTHKYEIKVLKREIDLTTIKDWSDENLYEVIGVITDIDKKTTEQIYEELLKYKNKVNDFTKRIKNGYSRIYISLGDDKEITSKDLNDLANIIGKDVLEGLINEIEKSIKENIEKHKGNTTASQRLEMILKNKKHDIRPILMMIKNKIKYIGNSKMKFISGKIHKKRTIKTVVNDCGFIRKKKDSFTINGVIYIDTSASISNESLEMVLDKVNSLIKQTDGKLIIKMFDTELYDMGLYTKGKIKNKITVIGRGGTDIYPVINDIKNNKYNQKKDMVLMLYSDLYYGNPNEDDINMFDIVMIDNVNAVDKNELDKINKNKIIEINPKR